MHDTLATWLQNIVGIVIATASSALAVRFVIALRAESPYPRSGAPNSLLNPDTVSDLLGSLRSELLLVGLTLALAGDLWLRRRGASVGVLAPLPHTTEFRAAIIACALAGTYFAAIVALLLGCALGWGQNEVTYKRRGRYICAVSAFVATISALTACLCAPVAAFLGAAFFLYCASGGVPRTMDRALATLFGERELYPRIAFSALAFAFFALGCLAAILEFPSPTP